MAKTKCDVGKPTSSRQYSLATAKDFTKELVASTPSQRNYKGILIALLVICAICGLILFAIYLLRPPDDGPRVKGRKVTLMDTISKRFVIPPYNGTWIADNEIRFRDSRGGISVLNTETLESKIFLSNTTFRQLNANKYSVSPDEQYILFIHDETAVWEHSSLAKYTIYDIENEFKFELNPYEEKEKSREVQQARLQHAEWGPTGNAVVLVYENDIYIKASANNTRAIRITHSGQTGVIFNGIPDWIYEVTVLKSHKALWMSPTGKFLVYASFNDSTVGEVSNPWYGETLAYPEMRKIRYPKAGTTNPEVTLWAVNVESKDALRPIRIKTPSVIDPRDHYLVNVQWIDSQEISVVWVNRQQNTAIFSTCSSDYWICKTIYTINPPGIGWLDFPQAPLFSNNKEKCLLRIPLRDGDAGYFHHVVRLDIKSGQIVPVTNGPFEVAEISAWDQSNQFIYLIGVPPKKPGERNLYRVQDGSTKDNRPICLTCPSTNGRTEMKDLKGTFEIDSKLTTPAPPGNNYTSGAPESTDIEPCLYNRAIFSPNYQLFVRECLGPDVPTVTLHQAPSGRFIFSLDLNEAMQEDVENLGIPLVKTFQVKVSDGYLIPARLYLPAGFREGEEFKFPLLLHVSGIPGTKLVTDKFGISWASYLTSQKNFIVVEIDGRGTGFGGENVRQAIHENFGGVQVADQLEVIKYLKDNLSFIDAENLAVWGKGYGGYLTLLIMAQDVNNLFKCAIAVAPITKWEFFNSVQTERFFGMPDTNTSGYQDGDIVRELPDGTTVVKNLEGRKFLLIHGTADEYVHFQHTLHLTKALINEGVSFTQQVYPDEGHEFLGVLDHLYATMETYLDSHFDIPDWEDWEKANFLGIKM